MHLPKYGMQNFYIIVIVSSIEFSAFLYCRDGVMFNL